MALRGPAILVALLAASGEAQETDPPAGVCLLQKSPSQTHNTPNHVAKRRQVGSLDLTAISAPLTTVQDLLDRHDKITMLIQQGGRRSGRAVHEAHSTVGKAITKLRKSSETLVEAAAGGNPAALHAAVLRIEAPTRELKKSLDHLEGVCLLQKSSSHTRKVEKHQHMGRSDLAALGSAHDNVHSLLDRHDKITMLIQQGGSRSGHAIHDAHSTVGKAITKLRKSYESLAEAASGGSPAALHTALLKIEAPAMELKKSLDHLEGVSLLQKIPGQIRKAHKHFRLGRSDLTALGAAYGNVHSLMDRHDKITMLIQQGGRRTGHAVHEAHSTVGKAITKLRKSYESLADVAASGGSPAALHAALLKVEAPAKELKKSLDNLEGVCLLQKSSSHTRKAEKHQHMGRSDLAALGAAHDLMDRHDKITMLIQQGGRRTGRAVHEAHSTVGKAITKLRKSYESLADVAASGGSPAALHTALLRVGAPAKELKKSLDVLEDVCLLQKHASNSQSQRLARADLAALGAAYDDVHGLLDRHDKITMLIQQGGGRLGHAAKQAHSAIGKAIKELRQSSESAVSLEAGAGSPGAMHTLLHQIQAPTRELKDGLDRLEAMIHEGDHPARGA